MTDKRKLIAVVGTTASGKSDIGIDLARHYGGEVVSADCRQVFRGLDLGSGKVTPEEIVGVPHHLIDIINPNDFFSTHDFQRLAYEAIDGIHGRGRLPFLVGGTGLYVASVTEGYGFSNTVPDLEYRDYLETLETEELYRRLVEIVPDTDVDPKNRNRVMRLLEKIHDGDDGQVHNDPRYDVLKLGITWDRDVLRQRIDERLVRRVQLGMIDEVRQLLADGATVEFMMKLGLEYRFITRYLIGDIATQEEMLELLGIAIKQFSKRQMTWFRRDKEIVWLDMNDKPLEEAIRLIDAFIK
ncbi:MAG: tRNA (adenosine(37)-N6)-dimethylallyltransferase MiaA [Clostridia bacterium]|nr:tRNA (adenosine(37)-N6)-dimethylallyltransferase MiaA [Clostridia bacterium]